MSISGHWCQLNANRKPTSDCGEEGRCSAISSAARQRAGRAVAWLHGSVMQLGSTWLLSGPRARRPWGKSPLARSLCPAPLYSGQTSLVLCLLSFSSSQGNAAFALPRREKGPLCASRKLTYIHRSPQPRSLMGLPHANEDSKSHNLIGPKGTVPDWSESPF